jgi:hypothetical protein
MQLTGPRQVRLIKCAILSPGLHLRARNAADAAALLNVGFDISPYVQQIDIYENIFDNTISGTLAILENVGLTEYIPLVGVETFALVFEIDTALGVRRFARSFRVVSITDQTFPRHDWRLYTVRLVTNEFVNSVSGRVCRAFHDMSCEEAVKNILLTDLNVDPAVMKTDEETFGKVDIVIPNYMPLQAINYFTTLAQTKKEPRESNFLFFETLDGFHFTSIAKLITDGLANPDKKVFDVNPGQMTTEPTVPESVALNAIMRVHQEQSFDLLFDIASGMLRSRMVTFDFLARTVSQDKDGDSRYTDSFKATTHLDKYPTYPENFDLTVDNNVRIFTVPTNLQSVQSRYIRANDRMPEQRMHEAVILRNRQLREIKHLQTLIDLPGQPDLRAGTVVVVKYPSSRTIEGKDNETINAPVWSDGTPYYSGNHLVTAVHHILTTKGPGSMEYRMNVKVNKDSLGAALIGTRSTEGL